jgi:hypothetical protein
MNYQEQRTEIERQMNEKGLKFDFYGMSDTNGLSIYYTVNEVKYRFSDHSVTNYDRIMNEKHFDLPFVGMLILGGIVKFYLKDIFTRKTIKTLN